MAGSQRSFETLINRFNNGLALINGWADYSPGNALIKKPALATFVSDVNAANTDVDNTFETLDELRADRLKKSFKVKELANDDCFQNRVTGIRNYVKGEDLPKATLAAIERIIKKIEPRYPKKPEGPPPPNPNGKHPRSPSERSFASIVGYGRSVITLITKLGVNYNPPDANLSVASMTTLVDAIEGLNKDVQNALDDYGTANRARKDLYTNIKTGLESRKKAILSYLASFPGLKKSNHYIEFNDALKGI